MRIQPWAQAVERQGTREAASSVRTIESRFVIGSRTREVEQIAGQRSTGLRIACVGVQSL
jgi:hypothetical protein